jgi:hypothetical protein
MPLESVNSLRMSQIMPANLAKQLESRRTSNKNNYNHPQPLIVLSSNLKGNHHHYGGIGSSSTTHVSSARRYQKQSIHTTTGEIMVSRPGPSSYVSARGAGNITARGARVGDSTRSASHSVQSRRMKSSQLIKEGRLEEAMQEVNTMLIVTNIPPKNARDDIS